MHSMKFIPAFVAISAGVASAAGSPTVTCTKGLNITQPTPVVSCQVIAGDVNVDESLSGTLSLEGVKEITGDLIINNATELLGFTSSTLKTIGGKLELVGLNLLSNLQLGSLESVDTILFQKLIQLNSMTFGSEGVSSANIVTITDTRLDSLEGLSIASVKELHITNNAQLTSLKSDLVNITGILEINANGNDMEVQMLKLESAAEIQISGVKDFEVPALTQVSKSLKFDTNPNLASFSAKNLTSISESLTFINNKNLANFSFPVLTKISGDMTIQNNTNLEELVGFPLLKSVFGGILLAGSFNKVELPKLENVEGSVKVTSTTDISDFCGFFNDLSTSGAIHGAETCTSNNKDALEGGDGGDSTTSSGSGSNSDKDDAAGIISVNTGILAAAAILAAVQLF